MGIIKRFLAVCDTCGNVHAKGADTWENAAFFARADDWHVEGDIVNCPPCISITPEGDAAPSVKHMPDATGRRVHVLRNDGVVIGSMPAAVGMNLHGGWEKPRGGGEIVKVNAKSIVVRREGQSDTRETDTMSVSRVEAERFGFPRRSS